MEGVDELTDIDGAELTRIQVGERGDVSIQAGDQILTLAFGREENRDRTEPGPKRDQRIVFGKKGIEIVRVDAAQGRIDHIDAKGFGGNIGGIDRPADSIGTVDVRNIVDALHASLPIPDQPTFGMRATMRMEAVSSSIFSQGRIQATAL